MPRYQVVNVVVNLTDPIRDLLSREVPASIPPTEELIRPVHSYPDPVAQTGDPDEVPEHQDPKHALALKHPVEE